MHYIRWRRAVAGVQVLFASGEEDRSPSTWHVSTYWLSPVVRLRRREWLPQMAIQGPVVRRLAVVDPTCHGGVCELSTVGIGMRDETTWSESESAWSHHQQMDDVDQNCY